MAIQERSEVPEDPHQSSICAYTIDDSCPGCLPGFTVTFSTNDLLARINRRILISGHVYFREFLKKPKPGDWLEFNPKGLSNIRDRADVKIGKVVAIHALRSSSKPTPERTLRALTKSRLNMMVDPSSITFITSYFKLRRRCWLVKEMKDGQFNCNC